MGSRAIDYVKMTKRDSHNVSREVDKMNGILFDIKQKKKYEEELKNRFSDALNTPAGDEMTEDQGLGANIANHLDDENAEVFNTQKYDGKRVRKDTEILSEAIKEH